MKKSRCSVRPLGSAGKATESPSRPVVASPTSRVLRTSSGKLVETAALATGEASPPIVKTPGAPDTAVSPVRLPADVTGCPAPSTTRTRTDADPVASEVSIAASGGVVSKGSEVPLACSGWCAVMKARNAEATANASIGCPSAVVEGQPTAGQGVAGIDPTRGHPSVARPRGGQGPAVRVDPPRAPAWHPWRPPGAARRAGPAAVLLWMQRDHAGPRGHDRAARRRAGTLRCARRPAPASG